MLPIFSNYNGRDIIGYAKTVIQAKIILNKQLNIHPKMTLYVWERPQHIQEILGLSAGFCYSISYNY